MPATDLECLIALSDKTTLLPAPASRWWRHLRPWVRGTAAGAVCGVLLGLVLVLTRGPLGERLFAGRLFWLDNVAGPWLVTAFLVGAISRRRAAGAVAGVIALLGALAVYEGVSLAGNLQDGVVLRYVPAARQFWIVAGVVAGTSCGMLGGWWAASPPRYWPALAVAGGVVAGEAMALIDAGMAGRAFLTAQVAAGLGAVVVVAGSRVRGRAFGLASAVAIGVVALERQTGVVIRLILG